MPLTRNVAACPSITPSSSGGIRRIKIKSSAGTITLSYRKSPTLNRNPYAGSFAEKNCDPVFGELSDLRDNKEFRCTGMSPDYYAALQRNFAVHNFWREPVEREFQDGISNGQEVVADIPDLHTDFIQRVKGEDDLSKTCEEIQDFELKSLKEGRTNSFSSSSLPDLDYLEYQVIEFPLLLREPDYKIVHRLTELDADNVITPLISEQNSDHAGTEHLFGEKMDKYLTSTRSKKRTRLNPEIERGSFSANFFSDLQFKSVNELTLLKESYDDNLKCSEALSGSNSDDDLDFKFVKERRVSKAKARKKKKTAAAAKSSKIQRVPLPRESVNVLREWMDRNIDNPFATKDQKLMLKELSGLTLQQVKSWLSNTRYKMKHQKSRAAASKEQMTASGP